MKTTIPIKNYELTQPFGKDAKPINIKIFASTNSERIRNIYINFSANRNERPLIQLLEEDNTKVKSVRLLLGENDISRFLDFLRNESNTNCIIEFDPVNGQKFGIGRDFDTNIEGGSFTVINMDSFALKSKAFNIKRNQLTHGFGNVFSK